MVVLSTISPTAANLVNKSPTAALPPREPVYENKIFLKVFWVINVLNNSLVINEWPTLSG